MINRPFALHIFLLITLLIGIPKTLVAGELRSRQEVYMAGSVVLVRTEPRRDAPVLAKLPIGTRGYLEGFRCVDPDKPKDPWNIGCAEIEGKVDKSWAFVHFGSIFYGVMNEDWRGWISTDLLTDQAPKLESVILKHDRTTADDLFERRKWAERAVALNPTSAESQRRLLDVLSKMDDVKALDAANRFFASYKDARAQTKSRSKEVFVFYQGQIGPVIFPESTDPDLPKIPYVWETEFYSRGTFYNLYSSGKRVGSVVTETQFNCKVQVCMRVNLARHISSDGLLKLGKGIATNFDVQLKQRPSIQTVAGYKVALNKLATSWVESSNERFESELVFRKLIKKNPTSVGVGTYSKDGNPMVVANWVIGSPGDEKYNNTDHASLLIIAEHQADGSFRLGEGSGSFKDSGCRYFDHLDVDGDGVDEIFLYCENLDSFAFSYLKRIDEKWQHLKGGVGW